MEVQPQAKLIDCSLDPERNVAVAARLCYSPQNPEEIDRSLSEEKVKQLNSRILDMGHHSVLEHSYFYFWLRGSRVFSHQLVRQRIGVSYSQRSQRYVAEDDFDYILPPSIATNPQAKELYERHLEETQGIYNQLTKLGIPREDARFALHQGTATEIMASYNARSLLHFFRLRCCRRAQWEIREIAEQMRDQVTEVAPEIFKNAGPACISFGECPEGDLSCGRLDEPEEGGN